MTEDAAFPEPPPLTTSGRILLWAAGVLFVVAVGALTALGLGFGDAFVLGVLFVGMPAISLAQLPLRHMREIDRIAAYRSSFVSLVVMGTLALAAGAWYRGFASLGFVSLPVGSLLFWTVATTLAVLLVSLAFRALSVVLGLREAPLVEALMPQSRQERREFAWISLAAGYGEEVAYRGYAIPIFAAWFGLGWAVVLTSLVFGVMHAYQGLIGTVRTGLIGGLLAGSFLLSGSLWPPILAHAAFDLIAGLVLADYLLYPGGDSGVEERPAHSLDSEEETSWT